MIRLHINVDHVATLRNARGTRYPDPVHAAKLCEMAGADGITMHLREDRRHIRDDDVVRAREQLDTLFNLEMAATVEMIELAARLRPDVITLVPERREEQTTEGGLDVLASREAIADTANLCIKHGIKLSLFIEAQQAQVQVSRELGANQVEFHTGRYCHLQGEAQHAELQRIAKATADAQRLGLEVAAGHGLTRHNVAPIARVVGIEELNIGHAVISDAVLMGMAEAVRSMREAVERGYRERGAGR